SIIKAYSATFSSATLVVFLIISFFFQAEDGIRYLTVTGVQTCALPIFGVAARAAGLRDAQQPFVRDLIAGYVAGCNLQLAESREIGRASCRERVWVLWGVGVFA